jgi:hypothetical protein
MLNKDVYTKAMINILDERLKFNNLKHKVILYSSSLGYEYNYQTLRIRPINSVFWFNILKADAASFLEFLNTQIDKVIKQDIESGWIKDFPFGNCENGIITIDMDTINLENISLVVDDPEEASLIWNEYYYFCLFLSKIYNESDKAFKDILMTVNFADIE